ncbi:autophagy protein atg9 [Blastocladiella emersonii ATCC 22665]|nr:autophagy protein atg9 [Blastocladiella emersonii ATCC 22665]
MYSTSQHARRAHPPSHRAQAAAAAAPRDQYHSVPTYPDGTPLSGRPQAPPAPREYAHDHDQQQQQQPHPSSNAPRRSSRSARASAAAARTRSALDPGGGTAGGGAGSRYMGRVSPSGYDSENESDEETDSDEAVHRTGLHHRDRGRRPSLTGPRPMGDHERALQLWLQAPSLDQFYSDVYNYFYGRGATCITLHRLTHLLRLAFACTLVVFLTSCVDYAPLHHITGPTPLSSITHADCPRLHPLVKALLLLALAAWSWSLWNLWRDQPALRKMQDFFTHVLEIPDSDIQSASWAQILARLEDVATFHPHPAHPPQPPASPNVATSPRRQLASSPPPGSPTSGSAAGAAAPAAAPLGCSMVEVTARIMRRENYLIALYSTEGLVNLTVPLPFVGAFLSPHLSKLLEWNIEFCVLGFVFGDSRVWVGPRRSIAYRAQIVQRLRYGFVAMAVLNAVLAPVLACALVVYFVLRYGDEYYRNPGTVGTPRFTPLARWQLRELNEAPHELEKRLCLAHAPTSRYLAQFPAAKTGILARFLAFLLGAVASVLLGLSLLFPDALLHLEVTPERTPVFYLGVLGSLLVVVRGMRGGDADVTPRFDPARDLREAIEHLHYCPRRWLAWGLHSDRVRAEVAVLAPARIMVYVHELLGVVCAPLVLAFSLPNCAERIVDFALDHTVFVQGLGFIYDGAMFMGRADVVGGEGDEEGAGSPVLVDSNPHPQSHAVAGGRLPAMEILVDASSDIADGDVEGHVAWDAAAETKMTSSMIHFQANHPTWRPTPAAAAHMDQITQAYLRHVAEDAFDATDLPAGRPARSPTRALSPRAGAQQSALHRSIYESIHLGAPPTARHHRRAGRTGETASQQQRVKPAREEASDLLDIHHHPAAPAPLTQQQQPLSILSAQLTAGSRASGTPNTTPSTAASAVATAAHFAAMNAAAGDPPLGDLLASPPASGITQQHQQQPMVASEVVPLVAAAPTQQQQQQQHATASVSVAADDMARMVHQFYVDDEDMHG